MQPPRELGVVVPASVVAAMWARAQRAGRSLEEEVGLALTEHVGHQRLGGEMLHVDDVVREGRSW